jgi:hypothetical protein
MQNMSFVLVEFSDKSLSVMDISSIDDCKNSPLNTGDEVVVKWPNGKKKVTENCPATILYIGGWCSSWKCFCFKNSVMLFL